MSRAPISTASGFASGLMTPSSAMFPSNVTSTFPNQPLSPNRSLQQQLSNRYFGQRGFPERRNVPGIGGATTPMGMGFALGGGLGGSSDQQSRIFNNHGGLTGFQGFGSSQPGMLRQNDNKTPPLLDLSEFPSLTNRGHGDAPQSNSSYGKQAYDNAFVTVGMVKQPQSESTEFTMSNEDFPALPGTQTNNNHDASSTTSSRSSERTMSALSTGLSNSINSMESRSNENNAPTNRAPGAEKSQLAKKGILSTNDGRVTNIPASMVKDQFGMVGLLTFIRVAESEPNIVQLALGSELTALGLNLSAQPGELYPYFGGPWAEAPCRPQDIDYHVPQEYLINSQIRDKLAPVKLNRYKDDLLFYMFYTNPGDVLQLAAAAELYNREWRYHKHEKFWISRAPGMQPVEKNSTFERGTYFFFDPKNWKKVAKEFVLEYEKLEDRPQMPSTLNPNPVQLQV